MDTDLLQEYLDGSLPNELYEAIEAQYTKDAQ